MPGGRLLPRGGVMRRRPVVYLLHFERPYEHARHYVGWTDNLDARLAEHRAGRGARLMAAVAAAGIQFTVARTWRGDRTFERRIHRRHASPRICPLCLAGGTVS